MERENGKFQSQRTQPKKYTPELPVEDELNMLHIWDDLDWIIEKTGLIEFVQIRENAYIEITHEFLSFFAHDPNIINVTFRLMNRNYNFDVGVFGNFFSFPVSHAGTFPQGVKAAGFWETISIGQYEGDRWRPGNSKEKSMYNLTFKIAHRILS